MRITSHTLVCNEERYIWYAINSIAPYMDEMIVYDTGSTDRTLEIIESIKLIYPNKIKLKKFGKVNFEEISKLRQQMLAETKNDWVFILDGDEVWWDRSIKRLIELVNSEGEKIDSIVVPYTNLVGDIYHKEKENMGKYLIDGKQGFLTIRAFNRNIPGIHVGRHYPFEGYFDGNNTLIQDMDHQKRKHLNAPFLHFTNFQRTDTMENNKLTTGRRRKFKYSLGQSLPLDFYYPEVFFKKKQKDIYFPWQERSNKYKLLASVSDCARIFKNFQK